MEVVSRSETWCVIVLKDSSENEDIQKHFDVVNSHTVIYNIGKFVTWKDEILLGIRTTEKGNEFLNSIKFREFFG